MGKWGKGTETPFTFSPFNLFTLSPFHLFPSLFFAPALHCQRNILSATTKLTTHQMSSTPTAIQLVAIVVPSFMTARNESFSAVRGRALMKGCRKFGKRADEKNVPDSSHMGII